MTVIVDPFDSNNAIVDGKRAVALRAFAPGSISDPSAPLAIELGGGTIIGYSTGFSDWPLAETSWPAEEEV